MKIIFFDIDGTLVDTDKSGKDAMVQAFLNVAELPEISQPIEVSGKTDRGIAEELFQVHGKKMSSDHWEIFIHDYLSGLESNLPNRNGQILPGIGSLLEQLAKEEQIELGLLTGNVARGADLKLGHFEIRHYFSFGGFGDEHPSRNDVAKMAHQQAEQQFEQSIKGEQMYVIGDTANDVKCARAIGAHAIAVATGNYSSETLAASQPDLLIENFSDPAPFLNYLA